MAMLSRRDACPCTRAAQPHVAQTGGGWTDTSAGPGRLLSTESSTSTPTAEGPVSQLGEPSLAAAYLV